MTCSLCGRPLAELFGPAVTVRTVLGPICSSCHVRHAGEERPAPDAPGQRLLPLA